jgi:DHA1 family tetracycline resistance protein-like MFS transporter
MVVSHRTAKSPRVPLQVYLVSIMTLLLISSVSVLHTNEYEFVFLRFEGITMFQLSLFDTLLYTSYLLFGFLTGILSDMTSRRRVFVIAGSTGSALLFILMTRTASYGLLLTLRFIQGACSVMAWQTLMTLVLDLSDHDNRGRCMGVFGGFFALSMGIGPLIGGILADRSTLLPYYTAATLGLLVAVSASLLLGEPSHISGRKPLKKSLAILKQMPGLAVPSLFNFVDRLHIGFILFLLPLFLKLDLDLGPESRGLILGIHALPFILLQYPVGRWSDRVGRLKILIPGTIGYGILLSLAGYIGTLGLGFTAAVFVLLGICSGLTGPTNAALVADISGGRNNALSMALFNLSGNLGIIAGPLLAGWLLEHLIPASSFVGGGIIEIAALLLALPLLRLFRIPYRRVSP